MLVGTPVVATISGGNPEALEDGCGVLVPGFEPKNLAQAAIELLEDDGRRTAMTERAKQSACRRFSRERHVSQVMEVYRELTGI